MRAARRDRGQTTRLGFGLGFGLGLGLGLGLGSRVRARARARVRSRVEVRRRGATEAEPLIEFVKLRRRRAYVGKKPTQPSASWRSGSTGLSEPDQASGCPKLPQAPVSLGQSALGPLGPLGPLWPALQALLSTWRRAEQHIVPG
eukprot:scaffold71501_cov27-Phaeocystis_antarctica.AAC.1